MIGEEKRGIRINIVDILITAAIAGIIALGVLMLANAFGTDAAAKTDVTVEYTIQFRGLKSEFANKVKSGDTVIDAQKRQGLGTVQSVKYSPYILDVYDPETGEMAAAEHPSYITLEITIRASGYISGEMYYVNGIKMGVGAGLSIHTKNFAGTGYISAMQVE